MKIDEYLTQHRETPFEAVIEPIADDPGRVKITPALAGSRCLCDASLVLDKEHIADVEPTPRTVTCCGKLRRIVRVTLRAEARIPATDVIARMVEDGSAGARRGHDPTDPEVCQEEAIWQFKVCTNSCRNSPDPAACRAHCRNRLAQDLESCNFGG